MKHFFLFLVGTLLCSVQVNGADKSPPSHPNIVVVLADDLGYGDVSCNNPQSKIPTANVDRLAAEGMRFTDAHTPSAVCTPTRYALLTGRYCWRTRLKYRVLDGFDPPLIEPGQVTVASLLKESGYTTAAVGKWHLGLQWTDKSGSAVAAVPLDRIAPPRPGHDVDFTRPFTGGPTAVGFDQFFGISASLNMSPFCYLQGDRAVHLPVIRQEKMRDANFMAVDEGVRSPDFTIHGVMPRLAGEAVSFIERQATASPARPFFLYAALTAPHLPVVTNAEYRGKSRAGEYGDFVVEMDAFLGAILETLDRTGLARDTLVIFTSDNGGLYHYWEAKEADDVKHYRIAGRAAHIREFGHQGNAHLRGTKADIWEGGHRVPFVVRWPGKTPAGSQSEELIELTDLLATAAAIVGKPLPPGAGRDSRNILPALLKVKPERPVRDFSVHHSCFGVFALRQGPWKLIPHRGSGGFTRPRDIDPAKEGGPPGQLYHLPSDPSETRNVYAEHPDVVRRLSQLLKTIQRDSD